MSLYLGNYCLYMHAWTSMVGLGSGWSLEAVCLHLRLKGGGGVVPFPLYFIYNLATKVRYFHVLRGQYTLLLAGELRQQIYKVRYIIVY